MTRSGTTFVQIRGESRKIIRQIRVIRSSFHRFSKYQHLRFAEVIIRRSNHPLPCFKAFDDLVILRVLPPNLDVAARGLAAIGREHINPLAARLLVESATRDELRLHGLAELQVEVIGLAAADVLGLLLHKLEVGLELAVAHLGIDLADLRCITLALSLEGGLQAGRNTVDVMLKGNDTSDAVKKIVSNTTLGVIMTNAEFDKMHLCKIAGMAHNGYARSIRPVHTSLDGDSIYAVSLGRIRTDADTVGTLAAMAMSEAILNAVYNADSAYGIVAAKDLSRG